MQTTTTNEMPTKYDNLKTQNLRPLRVQMDICKHERVTDTSAPLFPKSLIFT